MTRTKLWRLSLTAILGFGWLFLTPAYSDDPLSIAAERIAELNSNLNNLNDKAATQELISIAEDKYDIAVDARDSKILAEEAYEDAVDAESSALSLLNNKISDLNLAESAVDAQTPIVEGALTDKNNAQDALDIANLNLQTAQSTIQSAGSQGLQYTVYNLARVWPSIAVPDSVICSGTWNSNHMQLPVCGNRYENIVVKFTGRITVPSHWTSTYFAGYTDDGFKMYIDGQLAISNWVEQGSTWSPYSPVYNVTEDKTFDVEIWWYNGGGPGNYHLGWAIPGGWTGAGCDYTGGWGVGFSCNLNTFSHGEPATQAQIDAYDAAVIAQEEAEAEYNTKLGIYNTESDELSDLQNDLEQAQDEKDDAQTAHDGAQLNTAAALLAKNNAIEVYNNSIVDMNNAIAAAEEQYAIQWDFEEKQRIAAAIATALANMPQPEPTPEPSPEPTVEPTPEPSPEQTEPVDPTPEPTPETTDEPKPESTDDPEPTPEPSPEPSPQPTDTDPEPTPEPEPTPTEPSEESQEDNIIINEELKELIPEKGTGTSEDLSGVIANLTSKDNKLVILSKEQIAAVSQTLSALTQEAKQEVAEDLGIKSSEVAVIADAMKSNPELATAFVEFKDRAAEAGDAAMPYTLADATTEVQTEAFLSDPIGALTSINFEEIFNPSEWGKDMTDDQREKAQEVVVPVIIAGNIVAAAMTRRI